MEINMNGGGRVTIDGKTFSGSNISIVKDKVLVDGVVQEGSLVGDINVTVKGDVDYLKNTNGYVKANSVGEVVTTNGDVTADTIGNVTTTNGDVNAKVITGDVKTVNGDITNG